MPFFYFTMLRKASQEETQTNPSGAVLYVEGNLKQGGSVRGDLVRGRNVLGDCFLRGLHFGAGGGMIIIRKDYKSGRIKYA